MPGRKTRERLSKERQAGLLGRHHSDERKRGKRSLLAEEAGAGIGERKVFPLILVKQLEFFSGTVHRIVK